MRKLVVLGTLVGLLGVAGVSAPRHVTAAETHSNCIIFNPTGPPTLTPMCSETISQAGGPTQAQPDTNPCTGDLGTFKTSTRHQVYHINVNGAGDAWDSGTQNGTATFVPNDPSAPSGSGSWTSWFGDSFNAQNMVQHFTFNVSVRLTNGQTVTFHESGHLSFTPNGPSVTFDKTTISCS